MSKEQEISTEELNKILGGGASAANVIVTEEKKPLNVFTSQSKINDEVITEALKGTKKEDEVEEEEDLSKLDPEARAKREAEIAAEKKAKEEADAIIAAASGGGEHEEEEEEEEEEAGENLKFSKGALIKGISGLIDKKILTPFEGDKKLEDYTVDELTELIEENFKEHDKKAQEVISAQFFDTLSPEMQLIAQYDFNGGRDLKKLVSLLSESVDVNTIDIKTEKGQEEMIRLHLEQTDFGTSDEIKEEINAIKDRSELEKKATQFEPKVKARKKEEIDTRLKNQELLNKKQQAAVKKYQSDIYNVLAPGELNGIKLDNKVQETLYLGLIEARYPSINGKPTNLLGHLLEKKQFIEPDLPLISEVLWLLNNPEEYKAKIKAEGGKEATAKTVKKLKTAADSKSTNTTNLEQGGDGTKKNTGLKKPVGNFFKNPNVKT